MIGVSKAYITRVGGGPFPTEALDGAGDRIRQRGNEFGAVTGRPRRCGWFDAPLLRYTAAINGFDSLVITKLDVLDEFETHSGLRGYRAGGRELPRDAAAGRPRFEKVEPVYECLPGLEDSDVRRRVCYDDCRRGPRITWHFWRGAPGVEVGCISTGPERNQTIVRPGSRLEKLLT